MILGIFIASLSAVCAVDEKQPNQSKAVRLGFKDEKAIDDFNKQVEEYGKALSYLNRIGKEKSKDAGKFSEEEVRMAGDFVEGNREFDDKLRKFLSETSKTYGVTILGMALENAYKLGLREKPRNGASVDGAMRTIREFRNSYEKMVDESGRALNEIRFVPLKQK